MNNRFRRAKYACYAVNLCMSAVGLLACGLTGFCVPLLWPGNLIVDAERFPTGGVFIYAMMAAGDLGGSVGPQLVGVLTDAVIASQEASAIAETLGLSAEQLGMKAGMLTAALFPLLGTGMYLWFVLGKRRMFNKNS